MPNESYTRSFKPTLSSKDAILEPDIYDAVMLPYLQQGGKPVDAVGLLAESYAGVPSMINAAADCASQMGLDPQTILLDTIKRELITHFDPRRVDEALAGKEIPWLQKLIGDAQWRKLIYDLLKQHPRCEFLNQAVLEISRAGYQNEVASLRTASTYVEIYSCILNDALTHMMEKDDMELQDELSSFVRVCCEQEGTYLYAQALIRKLYQDFNAAAFARLSKELERAAIAKGQQTFVSLLKAFTNGAPPALMEAMEAIGGARPVRLGDIVQLYKLYSSASPPPVHHICDFDFIENLLRAIYVPGGTGANWKEETVDQAIFIIAYATSFNSTEPDESQNRIKDTCDVLKDLYKSLPQTSGVDLTGAIGSILTAIRTPVASLAVLLWIEYLSIETPYYETFYRSADVPLPHLLLDEIAHLRPIQRPMVFRVIKRCLKHKYQNFAPEILAKLQQRWVERLLYLVQVHYTIPVLDFVKTLTQDGEMDKSLPIYFLTKLVRMARPPYTVAFIEHVLAIIEPIEDMRYMVRDLDAAIREFIQNAFVSYQPLTDELCNKLKTMDQPRRRYSLQHCK